MSRLCIAVTGLLLAAAVPAYAAPSTLVSVGHDNRHPTATFSAPGVDDATIYMASQPDVATDGRFLSENIEDLDFLADEEIAAGSWLYEDRLDPGTYYLMLSADDFDCFTFEDPACVSGYSNALPLRIPRPLLRMRAAKRKMRAALRRKFGGSYRYGNFKRIKSCGRLTKSRVRCRRVSWSVGDLSFRGRLTASRTRVTGRIRRTDEYCKATGGRRCSKAYRVRAARYAP